MIRQIQQDQNINDYNTLNISKTSADKSQTKSLESEIKFTQIQANSKGNPVVIDQKYLLLEVLHQGKNSTIFNAIDLEKQQTCVIRMTLLSKRDNSNKILKYFTSLSQTTITNKYEDDKSTVGKQSPSLNLNFNSIVKLIDNGTFMNQYQYQVLEKTGPNIKFWFNFLTTRFSIESIILIILKSLQGLQLIHSTNFIHSNLNMASFLTSLYNDKHLFIGNLEEAIQYKKNTKYIKKSQHLTKYSSLGQHLGITLYPKDDLESLLYIVLQLLTDGEFFSKSKEFKSRGDKLQYYFFVKNQFLPEKILKDFPSCFTEFANKIKYLNPNEHPINYENLKQCFKNYKNLQFDWTPLVQGVKKQNCESSRQQSQGSLNLKQYYLDTISESHNEQLIDCTYHLFKNSKSLGDKLDINPETQESDGEVSFEECGINSFVYHFKNL